MGEFTVEKSIEVQAPAGAIWEELIKVKEWPKWKPFIKKTSLGSGAEKLSLGAKMKMNLALAGKPAAPLSVTISAFEANRYLAWSGGVKGLLSAVHSFKLEEQGPATKVITREEFKGVLLGLVSFVVKPADLEKLHEQWLLAIKQRMESRTSP